MSNSAHRPNPYRYTEEILQRRAAIQRRRDTLLGIAIAVGGLTILALTIIFLRGPVG